MLHEHYSDISDKEIQDFWATVERALVAVLKVNPSVARAYRHIIDRGPPSEKLLILHDDPFNVALGLSGRELTLEEKRDYFKTVRRLSVEDPSFVGEFGM